MEGGGGDEVARTLRARAGGWWWWWPGSLLSAPQPPRCLPFPPVPFPALCRLPAPLFPSRSLVCPAAPCPAPPPLTLRPPAHRAALSYSHFYLLLPHSHARCRGGAGRPGLPVFARHGSDPVEPGGGKQGCEQRLG